MARIIILAAVLVLTSLGIGVADDRFYLELRSGLMGLSAIDHNDTAAGERLESDYFPGFGVGGAFGYTIRQRFRLEAEIYYRRTPAGEFTLGGEDVGGSFDVDSLAVMANGFFDLRNRTKWTPYVGAGVGWALVKNDIDAFGCCFSDPPFVDDENGVFAYQLMVGITYQVTDSISIGIGYRFFGTLDPTFTDITGRRFESTYRTHNAEVGLRFRF